MTTGFTQLSEGQQVEALAELARTALQAWGDGDCTLSLLKYRENAVFRVATGGRPVAAMRLHRPGYRTDAHIRSEAAWMLALAADGIDTPALVPTATGDVLTIAAAAGVPEPRQCDRMGWIEGRPLGSLEQGVKLDEHALRAAYATIGELAARMHEHANRWTAPAGFSRPAWDIDSLVGDTPVFGRFWELEVLDDAQRAVLLRARDDAREHLRRLGPARQLIHGDLVPDNILLDGERLSVIDFDDCGWSWPVCELATSLFPLLVNGGFDAGLEGFLAGYGNVRAFPAHELEVLPGMLVARGLSYLGWPVGRPEIHSQRRVVEELVATAVEMVQALGS
jgi:Ser/Thr protein kinase RdoA (MazF antagonist)